MWLWLAISIIIAELHLKLLSKMKKMMGVISIFFKESFSLQALCIDLELKVLLVVHFLL